MKLHTCGVLDMQDRWGVHIVCVWGRVGGGGE